MLDQEQDLETFGCKHGLVAALVFQSEHVALDFRRPSTEVEVLTPPAIVNFDLSVQEVEEPAVVERRLKSAGVPLALVNYSHLQMRDSHGFPVTLQTDDAGAQTLESPNPSIADGGFPLQVRYKVPECQREFFTLKRFLAVSHPTPEGYENHVSTLFMGIPAMSLAPFPFHTAKLRALRQINQEEYDSFVHDISRGFSSAGIAHVVDNDYTLRFWDTAARHSDEKGYLETKFGLDQAPEQGPKPLRRLSLFAPLEQRQRAIDAINPLQQSNYHFVDLGAGHIQYGEQPFGFASGLNFRMMCAACLWVSIYFYVLEGIGSFSGGGMTVLPLAFWVPCRIPTDELFPVRSMPLGSGTVPRPPVQGVQLAEERWQKWLESDPLFEAVQHHYSIRDVSSRRRSIYYGRCRESLLRLVPATYRGAIPELLPMHDMSAVLEMGMGNTLEVMMGFRQIYRAAGLELYQDKIQLSKDFSQRGFRIPKVFYASYNENFDVRPTLEALEAEGFSYVAKASHLCCAQGVFVMDKGFDRLTNQRVSLDEIQRQLQYAFTHPFREDQVDAKCGDWGTVEAGKRPGVLVEELLRPSLPAKFLGLVGSTDWITPDNLACHLVWSTLLQCRWEIKVRAISGEPQTELLGVIFRDGSCLSCRYPPPFHDWAAAVRMLESLLPHTDYVRISLFVDKGWPVVNEVEYTSGGLEVVPVPIAREWTLQWLEGYYNFLS